jgi:hypothetical protein
MHTNEALRSTWLSDRFDVEEDKRPDSSVCAYERMVKQWSNGFGDIVLPG